jgi:hypothetical protein
VPSPAQMTESLHFVPPTANRIAIFVFLIVNPCGLLCAMTYSFLNRPLNTATGIAALAFVALLAFVVMLGLFLMTATAELTPTEIRRKTAFGERSLQISDVVSAVLIRGTRGGPNLMVRTAHDSIMFSNSAFGNAQLRQMQDAIQLRAAEIGRTVRTDWASAMPPPMHLVYLGILLLTMVLLAAFGIAYRVVPH